MQKTKTFFKKIIKNKKVLIIVGIVILVILFFILKPTDNSKNVTTEIAQSVNLKQTVLATGQVVSSTDLKLSFRSSGIVNDIKVKVGDKVKKGTVLASLDGDSERASLTTARGTLLAANAKLKRLEEGTEIGLAKIAVSSAERDLENIKKAQDTLVKNAYNNLLNSTPQAIPENGESDYQAPIISGSYTLGKEGKIYLNLYRSSSGYSYDVSGLVNGSGVNNTITSQPIGNSGLFIRFPEEDGINVKNWVIEIPNKQSSVYLSNLSAYETAQKTRDSLVSNAESILQARQAEYDYKLISSVGSELDFVRAEVLSAQGQYEQALSRYNDTLIIAPVSGTVTSIDTKIGRQINQNENALVLEDVSNMYLEADINEANISSLSIGMPVDVTFDAFGTDKIFKGEIKSIDLGSRVIGGVVNYKIEASVDQVEGLKPGMTANMTINVDEKNEVIAVPSRSIIEEKDGNKKIRLVTNTKTKKWKEVDVETGLDGDAGMIEITKGLSIGDEYIVLIKNK